MTRPTPPSPTPAPTSAAPPATDGLRANEERYRNLFVQAPVAQACATLEGGRFVACNPPFLELVGYEEQELLTRTVEDITHPDDWQRELQLFRSLLRGDAPSFTIDKRVTRRDGSVASLRVYASVIRNDRDEPYLVHAVVMDLSAQREAETALAVTEARYQALVELSDDLVVLLQPDGTISYASRNRSLLAGTTLRTIFDFIPPMDAPMVRDVLTDLGVRGAGARRLQLRTRVDGDVRHWDVRLENRLHEPAVGAIVAAFRDVTRRVQAEALAEGEAGILRMLLAGQPTTTVLSSVAALVEEQVPGAMCTILELRDGRLHHCAAPTMPQVFLSAVDGVPVGPNVGSCGTAAYRGQPVVVEDVLADPLWAGFRDLARSVGVRACWSLPVRDATGRVLGTFAVYHRQPVGPDEHAWGVTQRLCNLTALVLAQRGGSDAVETARTSSRAIGELTPRERDVLRLLALGHTNEEVAQQLYVGLRTVESHRSALSRKLGIRRRADLVRAALDADLLTP